MAKETRKRQLIRQRLASVRSEENFADGEDTVHNPEVYARGLDDGLKALSCEEEVCQLYQHLHRVDKPELVDQFESLLLNVINDVRQYQQENERLEKTYRREKDEHIKHLQRLEEEIEQQVQSVEERVRKQEKERLESEKLELRNQLNSEIEMLQCNLRKLQQNGDGKVNKEGQLVTLKKRLEEILAENRMLKSELTDAQTNLALIKSQMTSMKHQLDEKSYELLIDNRTVADYVRDIDKLRTQLHMLHEANKNLLDTNDNLRELLDSFPEGCPSFKRSFSIDSALSPRSAGTPSPSHPRKDFIMNDYADVHQRDFPEFTRPLRTEIMMISQFLSENGQGDDLAEDLDSGHSTLRDGVDDGNDDTELDSSSIHSDTKRGRHHNKLHQSLRMHDVNLDSHSEMDTDIERPESPDQETFLHQVDHKQSSSAGGWRSLQRMRPLFRNEPFFTQSSKSIRGTTKRQLPSLPTQDQVVPAIKASRDPERMFKLVLAGDAAVGKSSFIIRLCKGLFSTNLSSTLGVDFQTKMVDVDGQTTALQLWDTAGQERFRSVARTYFRRADGVLLLYDITYERSFLSLREWVDVIEDGSLKKIPIMLVGNKMDARPEVEKLGRRVVKREDGLRFSQEIDSLFIETSAKNGANILEAVIELTRLLRTNEDIEVKTVGLQVQEMINKKSSFCCKR